MAFTTASYPFVGGESYASAGAGPAAKAAEEGVGIGVGTTVETAVDKSASEQMVRGPRGRRDATGVLDIFSRAQ